MLLEGLFLPISTPFYPDGRLNLRKLEHNVDRYSKTPAAGFAMLSDAGDASLLTDEETREALKSAMDAAAIEKVMLAGVSRDSVFATLELAGYAAILGYDAVLVGLPKILQTAAGVAGEMIMKQTRAYFQTVADQSPLPLVLVSSAARRIALEVVLELAEHANVLGVVEGDGDAATIAALKASTAFVKRQATVTHVFAAVTGRMLVQRDTGAGATFISLDKLTDGATALAVAPPKPLLKTRTKQVGFQVLVGITTRMLGALRAGAMGVMPAFAACAPQACYEVLAAWKDDDQPLAEEKQARIEVAAARIEGELGSAGIRYACDLNGYYGGRPRLPLLPVTGDQRTEIESLMRAIKN
jgi:4-hydroxy-2-oxoglutarate aldolase